MDAKSEVVCKNKSSRHCRQGRSAYPWRALIFIMGNAVGQSATYVGLTAVLELYFARFLYVCTDNPKNLATSSTNIFLALAQICALTAGFLADRLIGNFALQIFGNIMSSLSLCLLLFSSWQYTLEEPSCCHHGNTTGNTSAHYYSDSSGDSPCHSMESHNLLLKSWNLNMLPELSFALAIFGLVMFALSYGHVNTIQSVFVGNQFSDTPEQRKAKERSFSWFYLWLNVGSLLGEGGMPILRQSVGFVYTLAVLAGISVVSTIWFWFGTCFYVLRRPECPKCLCSRCHRYSSVSDSMDEAKSLLNKKLPTSGKEQAKEEEEKTVETSQNERPNWLRLVKVALPIMGVFFPITVFWSLMFQQNSTWVAQGIDLNCYLGPLQVPPDMMPSFNDLLCILIIPFLDYIVVPHLERSMKVTVKALHKITAGMMSAAASFLFAGLLQLYVVPPPEDCRGGVHLAWQVPQYILISFGEVLVSVTGLQFAYSQAAPKYRNILTALWYFCQSLGTLLNAGVALIPIPAQYQYFAYSVTMLVVTAVFLFINRNYHYRHQEPMPLAHTTEVQVENVSQVVNDKVK